MHQSFTASSRAMVAGKDLTCFFFTCVFMANHRLAFSSYFAAAVAKVYIIVFAPMTTAHRLE